MTCPCGSTVDFAACCEPLLKGSAAASSPERLMRSRYVAYALGNLDYIVRTTDPQRRLELDEAGVRAWMDEAEFTGLEVLRHEESGTKGLVEFKARYRGADGIERTHHETSRFRKQAGVWYFAQGKVLAT